MKTGTQRDWTLRFVLAAALLAGPVSWGQPQAQPTEPAQPVLEDTGSSGTGTNAPGTAEAGAEQGKRSKGVHRGVIVVMGKNAVLEADDTAETVVAIGGKVTIFGTVKDAAVAIAGDVEVNGQVKGDTVSVLGDVKVNQGASVDGDVVAVGGKVTKDASATIKGDTQEMDFGILGIATPEWLRDWFVHCALKLRPLAPQVGWIWGVAGAFFIFYLLIAVIFQKPVQACAVEFVERPATTLFMGVLSWILVPIIFIILIATGIGVVAIPFLIAGMILAGIVGKVALLQALGQVIGRQLNARVLQAPLVGFIVGSVLVAILYIIPVLGLVTFGIIGTWALGGAVLAGFGGLRRELPRKRPEPPVTGPMDRPGSGPLAPADAEGSVSSEGLGAGGSAATASMVSTAPPVTESAAVYPKATFWERIGAGFLDLILVGILSGLVGGPPLGFLVALAYFAGMWAWKGTTVGGIVLGLKVVRVDDKPVSFAVAIVRALAGAFAIVVFFVGFLWIAFDREKQGWHDKIAGTVVLKLPRGTPLVCI